MYEITFLRHGESQGNAAGRIQGQSDYPLSERGIRQAQALAECWRSEGRVWDLIIASPLERALATARTIAGALHLPLETDPLWMERGFGRLEGMTLEEIFAAEPHTDFYEPYQAIGEQGESLLDVFQRASLGLQDILRRPAARYLVVTHGGLLNMTMYAILGISPLGHYGSPRFYFENTGYADVQYLPERRQWRLMSLMTRSYWKE